MSDPIDPLAARAHAGGQDAIDVAIDRIATLLDVRDEVLRGRAEAPHSFPAFGSTDSEVIGKRVLASLLNAGWSPPAEDDVRAAAEESRDASARFTAWLDSLSPLDRARALEHYSRTETWPPDLTPPSGR